MLKAFLRGGPHPGFSQGRAKELGLSMDPGKPSERANRFLQLLVTIDGVFTQKYVAFPEGAWNWEKFDRFVLGLLAMLLPDEFVDGEISKIAIETVRSAYADLKSARQRIKELGLHEKYQELLEEGRSGENPLLRLFVPEIKFLTEERDIYHKTCVLGILSQTRACGTPPPLVVLRSKIKFLQTVTEEPEPLDAFSEYLIQYTIEKILSEAPDEAFTGLQTKTGVRVATSACYEKTREEGGTAEAINDIVYEGTVGRPAIIRDLYTGAEVEQKLLDDLTPGEYIFWRCLEEVLALPPEELRKCFLLLVREPGKARAVTKALAALKIVLDLVNGVVSWPIGKAFPSSESGMLKESHGWNFFKDLLSDEELVFREKSVADTFGAVGVLLRTITYHDVFISSTDLETATDFMHHQVGRRVGSAIMRKCGIPPILRGIVMATCFQPRTVEFTGTGVLTAFGEKVPVAVGEPDLNVRRVTLRRGVLMGDPLTKPILHLINIGTRELAVTLSNESVHLFGLDLRKVIPA